ncbi:MAG: carboxylating nicotinate-nucleotide diphosphorylase [Deltaproteobacteria bacterium]|nr:carboxylating nicotinate-nucleotide diphosphorylase [Deltaproteobacteria bacterium]MBW2362133.1 carboxylating nicotinate-nucleotide diphosphorylase [Deltaproteobacteria bacterium]
MHRPPLPPPQSWRRLIALALEEDIGPGDLTTNAVVPEGAVGEAVVEAREPLVVCGGEVAAAVIRSLDSDTRIEQPREDGSSATHGDALLEVRGNLRGLLVAERTALNVLQRMCGVATHTRAYVDAVADTGARIVDTRKTLPGWRVLDKYAAAVGGAINHRMGLFDGVLIKDNHVALAGGVAAAVKAALAAAPRGIRVQVEVESEADAVAACDAGADFLLLDNCTPDELRAIVANVGDRALLEASGGITLENVRAVAKSGVQRISIGALTHSAPAVDISMEVRARGAATT